MQFSVNTIALATLAASAVVVVDARHARIWTFTGDNCDGVKSQEHFIRHGDSTCWPVTNQRSLHIINHSCTVITWSGQNCRGSSEEHKGLRNHCTSILFGSVSVKCRQGD